MSAFIFPSTLISPVSTLEYAVPSYSFRVRIFYMLYNATVRRKNDCIGCAGDEGVFINDSTILFVFSTLPMKLVCFVFYRTLFLGTNAILTHPYEYLDSYIPNSVCRRFSSLVHNFKLSRHLSLSSLICI